MPARLADAEKALGIKIDPQDFLKNPELQVKVENWHLADLDRQIADAGMYKLSGQNIGGYDVTPHGLIASAHLGGFGGLQKFIASKGGHNPNDGRTRIGDYMSYHAGGTVGGSEAPTTGLGGNTPTTGLGGKAYYEGLAAHGRGAKSGAPAITKFDPAAVYNASEEWAMANAPKGADASVIEGLAMDRFKKIQALYAQMTQGLGGGGKAGAPEPDEVGAAMKPPSAAKPEPAKAKTAAEAAAAATAGIGKRAEAAATTKETAATKKAQQVALDRVREVEGGVKLLSNIRDPALARSKATSHRAAILKDYEALSVEGQKQADGMLAKIADLFPDLR
jgi:hypothetical protein